MIVVLGSSNTDMVANCTHLPSKGETVMGEFFMAGGGKGANQAVAAARLGHEVHFLGCVGRDDFGEKALANLQAEGIDTGRVVIDNDATSGIALIYVAPNGDNMIAIAPGANSSLRPEHVMANKHIIARADILLTEFALRMDTIEAALDIAIENPTRVIVTPAPAQRLERSFLEKVDFITPNETEAQILTGITIDDLKCAEKASRALVKQGAKTAILTLGESGSLLCIDSEIFHAPAKRVHALDSTAAGDAYTGALAVALAEGKSIREAMEFANLAGAFAVTKHGAQPSLPHREELDQFIST